jgi:hypothetical protein
VCSRLLCTVQELVFAHIVNCPRMQDYGQIEGTPLEYFPARSITVCAANTLSFTCAFVTITVGARPPSLLRGTCLIRALNLSPLFSR